MTITRNGILKRLDQRGSALIGVTLLLMMISALAAALAVNGYTETLISHNEQVGMQAGAAAEAGLNHAVELATTFIDDWNTNGFASSDAAIDALLRGPDGMSGTVATDADNGSLGTRTGITAAEQIPLGTLLTVASGLDARYEASVMDDDATAPNEPTGDLFDDENGTIVIRATGYAEDDTKVVLEAMIGSVPNPAVLSDGDLDINGSVEITGTVGGVHSNGDLEIKGSKADISGTISASGVYTGSAPGAGGAAEIELLEIHAIDYRDRADYILTSEGEITDADGTVTCTDDCDGWDFDSGKSEWTLEKESPLPGTYYVEGDVEIKKAGKKSAKSDNDATANVSVVAEGSIKVTGNSNITAYDSEFLFVTDGDLSIKGGSVGEGFEGQVLVHEQMKLDGNAWLTGQFLVEDAADDHDLVKKNEIKGNLTISFSGFANSSDFSVMGWRDVRN